MFVFSFGGKYLWQPSTKSPPGGEKTITEVTGDKGAIHEKDTMLHAKDQQLNNPMLEGTLSTTTPLSSNKVSLGLGPLNIDELQVVKEDVGLKIPIIVKDYSIPEDTCGRYSGANISPSSVSFVKRKIMHIPCKNRKTTLSDVAHRKEDRREILIKRVLKFKVQSGESLLNCCHLHLQDTMLSFFLKITAILKDNMF